MSFPRYERYKDSGVEWLGKVPEHWEISLSKRYLTVQSGDMISYEDEKPEGYPLIGGNGLRAYTDRTNSPADTLVLGRVGAQCGCVHHLREAFWASEHAYRVIVRKSLDKRFFFYLLTALDLNQFAIKTAQPLLNTSIVETQWIAAPAVREQLAIGTFLDDETAKIDALIEEQRRLIDLLKEKRQAVISHAVTKGISASAPMKQTRDRWLGSIPDHWAVVGAKFVSTIFVPQRNKPELNQEGDGIPWITMDQMKEVEVENSGYWVSQEAAQAAGTRTLTKGAVVASCVGNFGAASVNVCDVVINQQLQAFIPNERIRTKFLRYRVESAKTYFEEIGTAATIPYVNQQGFAGMQIGLPPLCEQDKIVEFLDRVVSEIDNLITSATDAAAILGERRSALISAAVTGKIDVRDYTPKEAA